MSTGRHPFKWEGTTESVSRLLSGPMGLPKRDGSAELNTLARVARRALQFYFNILCFPILKSPLNILHIP